MDYEIVPLGAFGIIKNCAGCGRKVSYVSTGNFRINANKNQLDVWLIYQCPKCKHTFNLSVYERVRPDRIDAAEYQRFLENDADAALRCGLDRFIFAKNRAEIDWNGMAYELRAVDGEEREGQGNCSEEKYLRVQNPWGLKIKAESIAAKLLQTSRSRVKRMAQEETLTIKEDAKAGVIEIRVRKEP